MRNFDFFKVTTNHVIGRTSFRHLGYRNSFEAFAWKDFCSSSLVATYFSPSKLPARQPNGPIDPSQCQYNPQAMAASTCDMQE
jgi:hypothetical protein